MTHLSICLGDINRLKQEAERNVTKSSENDKRRSSSFVVGRYLLSRTVGAESLEKIRYGLKGKPYFIDTNLPKFNISHSQNKIALALSPRGEVGIDIEIIRPRPNIKSLAAHYFNEKEQMVLQYSDSVATLATFWQTWTAHEAVIKQRGQTIWDIKPEDTLPESLAKQALKLITYQNDYFVLSVCCDVTLHAVVRNFSD